MDENQTSLVQYLHVVEADTFGAGKTSYATECALQLERQGFRAGGVLSLPVYEHRGGASRWIGQDARLLPDGQQFTLARVGHPGWERRCAFQYLTRGHPRLNDDRRNLGVDPAAASRCLEHLQNILLDPGINAVVMDEVGTIFGGDSVPNRDPRMEEFCAALPESNKQVAVVTVQLKGTHHQHLALCVRSLLDAGRQADVDHLILDGLSPAPELPDALRALKPL